MIRDIRAAAEALFASGFRSEDMDELMIAYELGAEEAGQISTLLQEMAVDPDEPIEGDVGLW